MSELDKMLAEQGEEKNIGWPDWLLEKYESLPLPSLYDFILSQEKLAAEIRKQNRELKANTETLQEMTETMEQFSQKLQEVEECIHPEKDGLVHDQDEDEPFTGHAKNSYSDAPPEPKLKETYNLIIHAADALVNMLNGIERSKEEILKIVPETTGFLVKRKPEWRLFLEKALDGCTEGINAMRQKFLSQLADLGIELICPHCGSEFDPRLHRAVETVSGDKNGCIAKVIRYGYKMGDEIIRFADVSIYTKISFI